MSFILFPIPTQSPFSSHYFHTLSLTGTTVELKAKFSHVCMFSYMCEVISAVNTQFFISSLKMLCAQHIVTALLVSKTFSSDPYRSESGVLNFCVNTIFTQLVPREKMRRGGEGERAGFSLVKDPCRSFLRCCRYSGRHDDELGYFLLPNFFLNFSQKSFLNFVPTK